MPVGHLPPHHTLTSHYPPLLPYHEQVLDYAAGELYDTPHHVNGQQGSYQRHQYEYIHHQSYAITQNDASLHASLAPSDGMSYWAAAQIMIPGTDSVPTTLPVDAVHYSPSSYTNQDLLSIEHCHPTVVDHRSQSGASAASTASYGTAGLIYTGSTTLGVPSIVSAIPIHVPHLTIALNQGESGHDLMLQDARTRSPMYEGATTFPKTDVSHTQAGLYVVPYAMTGVPQTHHTPAPATKEDQEAYIAASAPQAQCQYEAPAPEPKARPTSVPPRTRSPMDHLPYPEDVAKAESMSRHSSVFSAGGLSSSPSSTPPRPLSPILQTLTFITYPDTEPKRHGRGGESDEHDNDDDGSPSRRGRRGKKQPKKDPFLACFFCRGRKIACHPKSEGGEDKTCLQCAKRHILCQYPLTSRRGQRKPQSPLVADLDSAPGPSGNSGGTGARAAGNHGRASSKLSTMSLPVAEGVC
ncbi:hypothetical protein BJV78DRAFT_1254546 [Lactifluus subvellereus]|nr:hypothetical protein BJV78DRAFT_1254546 [Lactifluus subvellereus]